MKCEFCNGNLDLESPVCPHCGAVNKYAQQHIKDMNRYQGQFEDTKRDVYKTAKKYSDVSVRLIVISVLAILLIVLLVIRANIYSVHWNWQNAKNKTNKSTHAAVMDEYLANEDYIKLAAYCEARNINRFSDEYDDYSFIIAASIYYKDFCQQMMGFVFPSKYDTEPERKIEWISSDLEFFYKESKQLQDRDYYRYQELTEADFAKSEECRANILENMNALLMTYLHLTREEVDNLPDMSEAQRQVLMEERASYVE